MKILLQIVLSCFILTGCAGGRILHDYRIQKGTSGFGSTDEVHKLSLTLSCDKTQYRVNENIRMHIRICNKGLDTAFIALPLRNTDFFGWLIGQKDKNWYALGNLPPAYAMRENDVSTFTNKDKVKLLRNEYIDITVNDFLKTFKPYKTRNNFKADSYSLTLHYYGWGFFPKDSTESVFNRIDKNKYKGSEFYKKLWPGSDTLRLVLIE